MTSRTFFLATVVFSLAAGVARGEDRVSRLLQILETDSSYKVRLQVVLSLGKLKDRRAVPALIRVLSDENYTVRGVTAAALAQIGDPRAVPDLKRTAENDSNAFVRTQAEKALKALSGAGTGPPPGVRFFVTVGKVSNKTGKGGAEAMKALGDALVREFSKVSGVATDWGGRNPTAAELTKRKMKGFVLDGAIVSLSSRRNGAAIEISCDIKVSLATYPGNSMKAFYSGGASTEVPAGRFRSEQEDSLFKDVLEGAAQGAREHIVQSFLSSQ